MTLRPDEIHPSTPTDKTYIYGWVGAGGTGFEWHYTGSQLDPAYSTVVGGDPAGACTNSGDSCVSDRTVTIHSGLDGCVSWMSPPPSESRCPPEATVTYVVEVTTYIFNVASVPVGSTSSLTLQAGPDVRTTPLASPENSV
jgi:hypothetical protein